MRCTSISRAASMATIEVAVNGRQSTDAKARCGAAQILGNLSIGRYTLSSDTAHEARRQLTSRCTSPRILVREVVHPSCKQPGSALPKVSVVLPVFNGELHIAEAIRSILSQSLADLALIVVDDGSVDSTALIVSSIEDRRIRLVRNSSNKGICFSLNRGLDLADSEYVARMDADDVARPTRLEAQVGFADRHDTVACCGSWMEEFGHGRRIVKRLPLRHASLTALMCFDSPLFHPTVVMRTRFMDTNHLRYSADAQDAEDYDMWERVAQLGRLANVGEVLHSYRVHEGQVSTLRRSQQVRTADAIRARAVRRFGVLDESDVPAFNRFCNLPLIVTMAELAEFIDIAKKGMSRSMRIGDEFAAEFRRGIVERWLYACVHGEGIADAPRFLAKGVGAIRLRQILESVLASYRLRRGDLVRLLADRIPRS